MLYVYAVVPPLPVTVTLPVELPLQSTLVILDDATLNTLGSVIVTLAVIVHPLLSFTPIVYVPAANDENVELLPYVPPPILYVYGVVPPFAVTLILPSPNPLHVTFV